LTEAIDSALPALPFLAAGAEEKSVPADWRFGIAFNAALKLYTIILSGFAKRMILYVGRGSSPQDPLKTMAHATAQRRDENLNIYSKPLIYLPD
jgi:hypothetical protein